MILKRVLIQWRATLRMRFSLLNIKIFAMLLMYPDVKQKAKNKWAAPHCAVLHFAGDYLFLPEEKAVKSNLPIWKCGPIKKNKSQSDQIAGLGTVQTRFHVILKTETGLWGTCLKKKQKLHKLVLKAGQICC